MKKRYILKYDDNQYGAIVARDGDETMVQVDDGDMAPVNFRPVLNGKAISIRFGGRLHLIHLSNAEGNGSVKATIGGRPVSLTVMDELRAQALQSLGDAAESGTIAADIPGLVVQIKVAVDAERTGCLHQWNRDGNSRFRGRFGEPWRCSGDHRTRTGRLT